MSPLGAHGTLGRGSLVLPPSKPCLKNEGTSPPTSRVRFPVGSRPCSPSCWCQLSLAPASVHAQGTEPHPKPSLDLSAGEHRNFLLPVMQDFSLPSLTSAWGQTPSPGFGPLTPVVSHGPLGGQHSCLQGRSVQPTGLLRLPVQQEAGVSGGQEEADAVEVGPHPGRVALPCPSSPKSASRASAPARATGLVPRGRRGERQALGAGPCHLGPWVRAGTHPLQQAGDGKARTTASGHGWLTLLELPDLPPPGPRSPMPLATRAACRPAPRGAGRGRPQTPGPAWGRGAGRSRAPHPAEHPRPRLKEPGTAGPLDTAFPQFLQQLP